MQAQEELSKSETNLNVQLNTITELQEQVYTCIENSLHF